MPGKEADVPVSVQGRLEFAHSSIFGTISSVCSVLDHRRMVLSCASSAANILYLFHMHFLSFYKQ